MKRKQSTGKEGKEGKERKRKERKDNKDNNKKDEKDTDSKSKSTTQKKRRRYTHKKKKAKLMKKRSIRRQRGGNPTVPDKQKKANAAAAAAAKRYGKPNEDDLSDLDDVLEKQTLEDKKEIAKQSARNTVSMLKKPLTKKETKLLRRLVFFNIYKPTNELRTDKYKRLKNIYDNIYNINYDSIEKINFVINELLKANIFSGAMNESSPDKNINTIYHENIDKTININVVLPEKTQKRIDNKEMRELDITGYGLIKQKVNIINDLILKRNEINIKEKKQSKQINEELSEVESKEIVKRELAKRKAAERAETQTTPEEAAKQAAEHLSNIKEKMEAEAARHEARKAALEAAEKAEKAAKEAAKEAAEREEAAAQEAAKAIKAKEAAQEAIKAKEAAEKEARQNSKKREAQRAAEEEAAAAAKAEEEARQAEKDKIFNIINKYINDLNKINIINGNTPPNTPDEKKLSKIAEQKYIVIPDPANNMKSIEFCEEKEGDGIPATARDYEFFIIFLDGYDKKTIVQYDGKTVENIQEDRYPIKDCTSGDA